MTGLFERLREARRAHAESADPRELNYMLPLLGAEHSAMGPILSTLESVKLRLQAMVAHEEGDATLRQAASLALRELNHLDASQADRGQL